MSSDLIDIKYRNEIVGIRTYRTKYIAEVTHRGLNDFKVFSSDNYGLLQNQVNIHVAKLEEKWNIVIGKQNIFKTREDTLKEAEERTKDAVYALKQIDDILLYSLDIGDTFDWEKLKDKAKFEVSSPENELGKRLAQIKKPCEPAKRSKPNGPIYSSYPAKPDVIDFTPNFSFFDNLLKSRKELKTQHAQALFENRVKEWTENCQNIYHSNLKLKENWEASCLMIDNSNQKMKEEYNKSLIDFEAQEKSVRQAVLNEVNVWEKTKTDFLLEQVQNNARVDKLKAEYFKGEQGAVLEYCELILNSSKYPESFPKTFDLDYNSETKILIVEYSLPTMEQLPTLNEVRYLKNELKEYHISDVQIQKIFDATMYKITLRTIHELFEADRAKVIEAISFNGWVNAINRATGKRENSCILSIQAKKSDFMEIDLRQVEPKTCFKNFKGVGSSKLSGLVAVQPILQISRTDRRFVNHYDVADSIDDSTNLAAMDWEDFEHLIREIFGKEFNANGGEVKVTQASKDGGVDAIAFDPDPIRGGKIVIQAKRYTNTVGVSAVRDLYGTVMNEGANKGILVTTADYGPDAYEFIKGKPLTLMNGANLLYLLEKHGHKAKIDIKEAKKMMKEL